MTKRDIHQEITDKIINILDSVSPDNYQAPFAGLASQGLPLNPTTEQAYHGINIPSLWCDQQVKGFTSNQWATFKQWKAQGAHVQKGEKGSLIIFYKTLEQTGENEKGEEETNYLPMMKSYTVFNANQVDGYDHNETEEAPEFDLVERIEQADQFCTKTGAEIKHGGTGAFYDRSGDYINLPETRNFVETEQVTATENYYATLLHELTHWTGAPRRLNRDKAKNRKEIEKYAFEELIAELGSALLCSKLGTTQAPREGHAHYIKSWLQALKNDKKFVFRASAQASKAVEYLNGF